MRYYLIPVRMVFTKMTRAKDVEKTDPFYPLLLGIQISTASMGGENV